MNNQEFSLPVYIVKAVKTSGFFYDLAPLEVGIFDKITRAVATAAGNGKEFFVSGGSIHTKDELTPFYHGMKKPRSTWSFLGKDIAAFEKSSARKPRNEEWTLGYGGGADDNTLKYDCESTYQLKIRLFGEPAFRLAGKSMEKVVTLVTPCCDDTCTDGCVDNSIDPKIQTQKWVDLINANPDLKGWKLKAQPVFEDYAATTANAFNFILTVTDSGDAPALQEVQRAYPTYKSIERISYNNGKSVYRVKGLTATPATFTPKVYYVLPDCGVCPAGYTLTAGYDTYIISRNLNTTTDLDDTASQTTFAAAIVTAYSAVSGSGVYLGQKEGYANVRISVTSGTTVNIASGTADIVTKDFSQPSVCTPAAASAISWALAGSGYTKTRTLTTVISTEDCNLTGITETALNTFMTAALPSYVASSANDISGSGDICVKKFEITQTSNFMDGDLCQSPDNATFEDVPAWYGEPWVPTPPTADNTSTVKAGIRFTAPFYSPSFGDCSYDPLEYSDAVPLRMEVSIFDQNMNPCTFSEIANARRTLAPKYQNFDGNTIRREYIMQAISTYFTYEDFAADPRSREIVDNTVLSQISKDKYFVAYYLRFQENRGSINFNQKKQVFEPVFYIEEGDVATQIAFEKAILAVTAKFGVGLKQRS